MNTQNSKSIIVRTFMTHDMKDDDIAALSTGRDPEFQRIMGAIHRSLEMAPGVLQHVVLYGARGFGKSFMTRRVQIEVSKLSNDEKKILYILFPEEQHNLQRSPYAFIENITINLKNVNGKGDEIFQDALFQWPKPGENARRWDEAVFNLEKMIDEALPNKRGLVIIVVENFDLLLSTLFKEQTDEQRLRLWLDRTNNRVMLLATATGTVDLNYDRPLFHAFESIRLSPWSAADCTNYFNRQREYEGRPLLDNSQAAKARAIADFIGGTPRLAQLLAEVLDTQDALTVAQTMSALADKLAEYYRRRIEDLPPLSRGLLDALIRGGEPASQTQLAVRVGAGGQSDIARTMSELQRADIVRGRPSPNSREVLYSVVDRVFVHYYRLRQGSRVAYNTPLATILDFLRSFYSRDEQRFQGFKHLEAGRPAEAGLFSRLALEGEPQIDTRFTSSFMYRLKQYVSDSQDLSEIDIETISSIKENAEDVYDKIRNICIVSEVQSAVYACVKAQALYHLGHTDKVEPEMKEALYSIKSHEGRVILALELATYHYFTSKNYEACRDICEDILDLENAALPSRVFLLAFPLVCRMSLRNGEYSKAYSISLKAESVAKKIGLKRNAISAMCFQASALNHLERYEEAYSLSGKTASLSAEGGYDNEEITALRQRITALGNLKRTEDLTICLSRISEISNKNGAVEQEIGTNILLASAFNHVGNAVAALEVADKTVHLCRENESRTEEAKALRISAHSLTTLGRYEEAIFRSNEAIEIARELEDTEEEATILSNLAYVFGQTGQFIEALEVAERATLIAETIGNKREEAVSLRQAAFALSLLERDDEAIEAAYKCYELAMEVGDLREAALSLQRAALSVAYLGRHEEAIDLNRRSAVLAKEAGEPSDEASALRQTAFIMNRIEKWDEGLKLAQQAVALARQCSDDKEIIQALIVTSDALTRIEKFDEALEAAYEALNIARMSHDELDEASCLERLSITLLQRGSLPEAWNAIEAAGNIFINQKYVIMSAWLHTAAAIACQVPQLNSLDLFSRWVEKLINTQNERYFAEDMTLSRLFVAAGVARRFEELDSLVERHGKRLSELVHLFWFSKEHGEYIALFAAERGRAAAYELISELFPRIDRFIRNIPSEYQDKSWLADILVGFAAECRDSGLMRDVASLLELSTYPQAEFSALLLREIARFDENGGDVNFLVVLDPDIATLIRKLRNIPDLNHTVKGKGRSRKVKKTSI